MTYWVIFFIYKFNCKKSFIFFIFFIVILQHNYIFYSTYYTIYQTYASIYIYIYYKSLHIIQIIKHMWLHHVGGANRLIIGLLWMVGGMKNVTTTGPSSVKGTSSKFVKAKTVKAIPQNVTEFSVTFVLQSFPGRKLKYLQRRTVQGLAHPLLLLYQ